MFWLIMIERVHKEKLRVETRLVNFKNILLGINGFVIFFVLGAVSAIAWRFDPAFHEKTDYPQIHNVFFISMLIFLFILAFHFIRNFYIIYVQWNRLIPRHRVFIMVSVYFIFSFFVIALKGYYSTYDENGRKIFVIIFLNNFYVYLL